MRVWMNISRNTPTTRRHYVFGGQAEVTRLQDQREGRSRTANVAGQTSDASANVRPLRHLLVTISSNNHNPSPQQHQSTFSPPMLRRPSLHPPLRCLRSATPSSPNQMRQSFNPGTLRQSRHRGQPQSRRFSMLKMPTKLSMPGRSLPQSLCIPVKKMSGHLHQFPRGQNALKNAQQIAICFPC